MATPGIHAQAIALNHLWRLNDMLDPSRVSFGPEIENPEPNIEATIT